MFVERTIDQRRAEIKPIIEKLQELELSMKYEPVVKLYKQMNQYVITGERQEINILFEGVDRRIKGVLTNNALEPCVIKLIAQ